MAIGTTLFCHNDPYIAQLIYARALILLGEFDLHPGRWQSLPWSISQAARRGYISGRARCTTWIAIAPSPTSNFFRLTVQPDHLISAGSLLIAPPRLAHNFVLRIRASRTTDCADNSTKVDQWNAASRRDDSIEREQIVEMHKLNTVLEDLQSAARRLRQLSPYVPQSEWRRASRRPFVGRQLSYHRNRPLLRSFSNFVSWPLLPRLE